MTSGGLELCEGVRSEATVVIILESGHQDQTGGIKKPSPLSAY